MRSFSISRVLQQFGKPVTLICKGEVAGREGFAFLQAVAERKERGRQFVPSPLGMMRDERFLYFGEASLSLDGMEGGYLLCEGDFYVISSAQPVYVGKTLSHWRAVLTRKEEEGL